MESLFGIDLPLPVKLIVAFVIVLGLIGLATWVFRRLGGDRVAPSGPRGRQPRLAVIDAALVDGRRRLVLVRRDNVEHLIMIGGPADLVIEQNIVRAVPVAQQMPRVPVESPARALPEQGPARPAVESAYRERPAERLAEPQPRPRLEAIQRPAPRQPTEAPRLAAGGGDGGRGGPRLAARRLEPELRRDPDMRREPEARRIEPELAPEVQPAAPTADTSLADMASKLEAALRRPAPRVEPEIGSVLHGPTPPTVPSAEPMGPPKPEPTVAGPAAPVPAASAPSPVAAHEQKSIAATNPPAPAANAEPKSMFDSLEEEMASLLGRPPAKL